MPMPRLPTAKAELTGAAAHDPQRYRARSEPQSPPLGKAPEWMKGRMRKAWNDFAREWTWLGEGDRASMIAVAQMRAEIEDPAVLKTAAMYGQYRLMLSEHGGTPVSRSKVYQAKDEVEDDPFAGFGGAVN